MDAPLIIEREIDLDVPADELWELISTAEGWRKWLVDTADFAVLSGAVGAVVDDGVERAVSVHEIAFGRLVRFHWCEPGGVDDLSVVTLEVVERPDGRRGLRITEEWLAPQACAGCPLRAADRWDLRECVLCLTAIASCRV